VAYKSVTMALESRELDSNVSSKADTQSGINTLPCKRVFDLREAADIIGVKPDTVRRLIKGGKIAKLPIRHIRISSVELDRFLADGICGEGS
jgi:excisionase family DNA binding protein